MGRSGGGVNAGGNAGGNNAGGANTGGARGPAMTKMLTGAAAIVVALVCYVFGVQPTTSVSSSASNSQVAATQTSASESVGNLTFRSEERLREHYEKHGKEMGFTSAEAYLAAANKVVANPGAQHKTESEDGDDAYFLEETGEFVVVSRKGYIRTYFLADRDYFERQ